MVVVMVVVCVVVVVVLVVGSRGEMWAWVVMEERRVVGVVVR